MAFSGAPHPLAEAIADLAAPPMEPCYVIVMLDAVVGLVLRPRPRPRAAGLEVAVHPGIQLQGVNEIGQWGVQAAGAVLAVPPGPGGVEWLVRRIAAGKWSVNLGEDEVDVDMRLRRNPAGNPGWNPAGDPGWQFAKLLLDPADVISIAPVPNRPAMRVLTLPRTHLMFQHVFNTADKCLQERQRAEAAADSEAANAAAEAAGAAAAAPQPQLESEEAFRSRFAQLAQESEEALISEVATFIQLACFKGVDTLPEHQAQQRAARTWQDP